MRTDHDVVRAVLSGDVEAFRILVVRYQDLLYRHALRMTREPAVAEDLVQAAFVKAFSDLRRCRELDRFGGWLFRIVANACKDHLKSGRRHDVVFDEQSDVLHAPEPDALTQLERSELRGMLQDALERLPVVLREAFVLKHLEGCSYEQMAELLDSSVPALKMRVHRAREALQTMLETVIE